ncbi:MAG TPA: carboxylesterase family protein [Terracidiphilus sp.]|nr:carboxylesterase family protein [Terracidiphilus sp.]
MQRAISRRAFLTSGAMAAMSLRGGLLHALASATPVTVRTPNGALRGEQSDGVNVFRGVPFAEPPVGPLRFRPPVKAKRWTGERDATRFAAAPMQGGLPAVEKSEDCLYLNIWAPQGKGPFPVYVWIHGGGFTGGYSFAPVFDGSELARAGIICVTVAYRLGVFGFLNVEPLLGADFAGSANNGLRDLMEALTWVRQNIAAFGGDPERVTVGGQSAGAKLTDILLGVPSAQPLFKQAISESGGAERVATREASEAVGRGFGAQWRSRTGNEMASLLTAPAALLIQTQGPFITQWPQHFPLRAEIDGVLLPRLPVETIAAGSSLDRRLLIGTNREESASFLGPHPEHDPGAADLGNVPVARFTEVLHKYRAVYPQMTDEQLRIRAATAEEYWVPSVRVAEAFLKGGGKAWMYRLDFAERVGLLRGFAHHSLDVRLVWDRPIARGENAEAEARLAQEMDQAWMAFLRGRTPASNGLPAWPEYTSEAQATMALDTESHVELHPQEAELRLWNGVL